MVLPVTPRPPADGPLDGPGPANQQKPAEQLSCIVRAVRPVPVVPRGDPETGPEVKNDGPDCGRGAQGHGEQAVEGNQGRGGEEDKVHPVDFLERGGQGRVGRLVHKVWSDVARCRWRRRLVELGRDLHFLDGRGGGGHLPERSEGRQHTQHTGTPQEYKSRNQVKSSKPCGKERCEGGGKRRGKER